ncbi:MAG: PAS domain S-box protein [Bacteroidota bacterium]
MDGFIRKISLKNISILAAIATIIELLLLLFSTSHTARIISSNIATIGGSIFAIFMILFALKASAKKFDHYRFWLLLVFAFLFNLAGEAIYNYLEIISHQTPFPSIADPFYLAFYPIILIAMFLFPSGKHSTHRKYIIIIEMLVVLLSSLMIFTEFLFGPILNNNESLLEKVLSIFYPAGDFLVLWAVIYILFSKISKDDTRIIFLLALGLLMFVFADIIYSFLNADNLYYTGHISDITYFIAYVFCGLSAVAFVENTQKEASDEKATENIQWMAYSPYIFLLISIFAFYYVARKETYLNPDIIGTSIIAIVVLILLRQILFFQEFKKLNIELIESEKKYKLITENSTDLIYVYSFVPEPHFEYLSPSCKLLTGYEPEEVYREPDFYLKLAADKENIKYFASVLKNQYLPSKIEERWRKKDGSIIWVEQLISRNFDEKGNLISFQATVRDITERKQAEALIKESEERFRSIAENSTDVIALTDNQGIITYISPASKAVFGYEPNEMIGKKFTNFLDTSSIPLALGEFRAAIEFLGRTKNLELLMKRKDGSTFYGELNGVVYQTCSFFGTLVTIRDISERKEADNVVQSSRAMYKSVFEATGTATIIVDEHGTILEANLQCLQDTGYSPEELVGTKWTNYVAKESLDMMIKYHNLRRIDPKLAPNSYEVKLINKKGEVRDVLLFANIIPNTKRSVVSMLDLTERKRLEQSLRKSEQQYRLIMENVSEMIFLARDGKIIMANPKVIDFLGYSMEHIQNTPFIEFIHPDDRQMVLERHIKRLNKLIDEKETYEFRIVRSNGEIRNVEINVSLIEWDEKPTTINFLRDITERKRIEQELRESERRLQTLMNNLPGMAYRCKNDRNWTMEFVSDGCEELCGYKPEELLNNNVISFNDLINPEDRDWIWEAWQDKLSRKEKMTLEYQITCKDGTQKWVWEQGQGVFNENGELEALEGYIIDITERKRIEEEMKVSKEYISAIFNSVTDAIFVDDADTGEIIDVNKATCEMYGYSYEELLKTPIGDLSLGEPPYSQEDAIKWLTKTRQEGPQTFEWIAKRKDGSLFWVEVSSHFISVGDKNRFVVSVRDISRRKKIEEELKVSYERFDLAIKGTNDGIWDWDIVANKHYRSPRWKAMLGYAENELPDDEETFHNLIYEGDLPRVTKHLNDYLEGRTKDYEIEFRIKHKDGSLRWVLARGVAIRDENNKPIRMAGSHTDITQRKQAEQELMMAKETYENIFNSVAEAIYIQDENGRFLEVNLGAQLMYGYSRNELVGKTPADVSAPGMNDLEKVQRIFEQVQKDGVSRSFEFWGVRKNGEIFPKDVSMNKGKYFGKDCIIAIARDISERKQAEKLLQDTKNTYMSIYNSVSEAIYVIDENGYFVDVNVGAEKMYGYTREELLNKNFFEVSAPGMNDLELMMKIGLEVLTTGEPKHIEFWGIRKNGEVFPKEISINKGKYFGKDRIIVSGRDISERKRAEQELIRTNTELEKANSEKDKFFSIISHDLRSPFNSFLSITKILSEQFSKIKMSEVQQYAKDLNSSAENLFKLLENLLSWSRLKRGVINFKPEELLLREVVDACAYMLKGPIEQKEQKLNINISSDIYVYADRPMLDTVVRNLLSNASKFTPRGGSICISAKTDCNNAIVSVKDNGIGIPEEIVDKLFDIGVKTSRKGTEDEPSSGLGLILCKEFVEKNGGKLWLESIEGEGTTFYFTVPLIKI